ncbi:MAG: carbohydrate ABC transporter permease [Firmicutes bacterium]|nr:carbohydrate ABC transporter permease [Bacillota bacterium]
MTDMDNKTMSHGPRKRLQIEPIIFHTINYTLLGLLCLIMLYPMLNTVALSFNDGLDAIRGGVRLWPRRFTLNNYQTLFAVPTVFPAFRISIIRVVVTVISNLVVTSMLAYAISRPEYKFRKPIALIIVLTMYFHAGLIPHFILRQSLGLLNTFAVLWVPGMVGAFNLIIIRTYIKSLPESLVESARLDGASDFRIFAQVIMPLCKPVLATVTLFVAVGAWNEWFDAFIYNSARPDLEVLQGVLRQFLAAAMAHAAGGGGGQAAAAAAAAGAPVMATPLTLRAAITVFTALPILLVFPFLQRYIIHGMTLGGVKE